MKRALVLGVSLWSVMSIAGNLPEVETRSAASTAPVASLSERVTRLEQQMGTNTTLQFTQRLEALQQEVQELRGVVEELQNQRSSTASEASTPASRARNEAAVSAAITPEGEKNLYQIAYQKLQARDYQTASHTLHMLLEQYPQGENAPNAYYWLGEISLIQGNTTEAQKYFETVITQFPEYSKVSDAILKTGYIAYTNEDYVQAKKLLDQVVKQYPDSSAARLAIARLQKMKKAGQI